MSSASHQLGRAAAAPWSAVPEAARKRVVFLLADVLAAAVSAWNRPELRAVRPALLAAGTGPVTVIGRSDGAAPPVAALTNAMAVAAEQLQDGHREARGHPASHVVPAVLAAAEAADVPGPETLVAVLAGCEVGIRVGDAMGGTPPGVHDISTWGAIGAAAGVARAVAGSNPEAIAAAIDLAATLPTRPDAHTVFAGADGQHLLLGLAAQTGVVVGSSAAAGLRAPAGTLERHFLAAVGARPEPDRLTNGLTGSGWDRYRVVDGYVKRHPTCAHLHGVNDAVEDLLADGPFDPAAIDTIEVRTYEAAAAFAEPAPVNDLAARFSIPYTVAVALVSGRLEAASFTSRWMSDPAVRFLATRVQVRHDPTLDSGYPSGRPAVVTVRQRGGALEASAGRPRGDGPEALEHPGVAAKPRTLLTATVGEEAASAVVAAVASLEREGTGPLRQVLRRLAPAAGQSSS